MSENGNDRALTAQELAEIEQIIQEEAQDQVEQAVPPATIILKDGSAFRVKDVDAWQWHPKGIFATGYFVQDENQIEQDIIFWDDSIAMLSADFTALQRYEDEQREAEVG